MSKHANPQVYSKPTFYDSNADLPCKANPDAFWLEDKDGWELRGERRRAAIALARTYCADCRVRIECLGFALRTHQEGVWGGTTDEERARLRKQPPSSARRAEAA